MKLNCRVTLVVGGEGGGNCVSSAHSHWILAVCRSNLGDTFVVIVDGRFTGHTVNNRKMLPFTDLLPSDHSTYLGDKCKDGLSFLSVTQNKHASACVCMRSHACVCA